MSDEATIPNPAPWTTAAKFVAHWEGFKPRAYWDVNAWRIGFGSDTKGASQTPVKQGDETTYSDALDNLTIRVGQFATHVMNQVGAARWSGLPDNTRVALIDFAYNYGSLTPTLAQLVRSGSLSQVVSEIQLRAIDNDFENKCRRFAESSLVAMDL